MHCRGRVRPAPDLAKPDALRRGAVELVVDEVETVFEPGLHDFGLRVEHRRRLHRRAVAHRVDRGRVELVAVLEVLGLPVVDAVVFDLNGVQVVRIEAEDGNAAVREDLTARDVVLDFLAVRLRDDADLRVLDFIAAVADHGRERGDLVRVPDDLADVALNGVGDVGAGSAAHRHGVGGGERHAGRGGRDRGVLERELHLENSFGRKDLVKGAKSPDALKSRDGPRG